MRAMIDSNNPQLTVQTQCRLLGLSLSSYHYAPKLTSPEDEKLMRLLDQHYTDYPFEGKVKRAKWLTAQVHCPIGVRKVRSLMT